MPFGVSLFWLWAVPLFCSAATLLYLFLADGRRCALLSCALSGVVVALLWFSGGTATLVAMLIGPWIVFLITVLGAVGCNIAAGEPLDRDAA